MRIFRFLNIAILSALLGSAALLFAQDDKQQDNHPAPQDQARPDDASRPPAEAKPARPDAANPPRQDEKQDQLHPQATPERADHPEQPAPKAQPAPNRQMGNAGNDHPNGQAHGQGGRIPDNQFRAHFGQQHHFRAQGVIVAGQPRFQYGGYNFQLVQAWPAGWAYTDDCYIDYIDGQYFLIDLSHPGIEIPLIVVM